jgi:pyruvate,orthophosphate dikinase
VMRLSPDQARQMLSPRIASRARAGARTLACGEPASPGVGVGRVVGDSDEAERRARAGEAVILARPTTSPDDLHGMIAARAVVTEHGGATSHAAVVGRALGLPCVVGCGAGALAALIGRTVTVDGGAGKVYADALAIEAPDASEYPALAQLAEWAARISPLRVVPPTAAEAAAAVELGEGAADPDGIGDALRRIGAAAGARGGAIASEQGVRAALSAGLAFIVADPVLPPLLAAVRAAAEAPAEVRT